MNRYLMSAVLVLSIASSAFAATGAEKRQCLASAKATYQGCTTTCKTAYVDEKLACGANPPCYRACNGGYDECVKPYKEAKEACYDVCDAPYSTAINTCKTQIGCTGNCWTTVSFLSCVRAAGVTRFNCRQDCNDSQRLDPVVQAAMKACSAGKKACQRECRNPLPTPAPVKE